MPNRTVTGIAVVTLLIVAAVALLTRDMPAGEIDRDGRLEIVMHDYAFEIDEWTVPAGQSVTLVLVNRDEVSHPLTFGGELIVEDGRPVDYTNELFDGLSPRVVPASAVVASDEQHEGFTVQVPGGTTVTIEVAFPTDRVGTWGVGCFLGRGCHFNAGLTGSLHVVAASPST